MSDRASSLARLLITRLISVEIGLLDDAGPRDEVREIEVRRDMVAKVLASELGITEEASISRVIEFLPRAIPGERTPDREFTELADLLRNNLLLD